MIEGVYAIILLVVVCMMLGIVEVPARGAGTETRPEPPQARRRRPGPSREFQQAAERTSLRRLFPSRLV